MGMTNAEKQAAWRRRQKEKLTQKSTEGGYVTVAKAAHAKAVALAEENKTLRVRIAELETRVDGPKEATAKIKQLETMEQVRQEAMARLRNRIADLEAEVKQLRSMDAMMNELEGV